MNRIIELQALADYYGPNPYAPSPVVVSVLKFANESDPNVERMYQQLLERYPEWIERTLDLTESPEHRVANALVLWAQRALNEVRGCVEAAGVQVKNNGVLLWLGFHDVKVSRAALSLALLAFYDDVSIEVIQGQLNQLWQVCRRRHPDYQASILIKAAEASGIPWRLIVDGGRYWQFGWGKCSRIFFESASNEDGFLGGRLSGDKAASKAFFSRLGIPSPKHHLVQDEADLEGAVRIIGWPCVIKPVTGGCGMGVTAGIRNFEQLREGFSIARKHSRGTLMLEAFVPGDDHRLMVIDGRLTHAIRREASFLIGDGTSRIKNLLAGLNAQRSVNMAKSRYLQRIPSDDILLRHLAQQGVTLDSVLEVGRKITLRSNANRSTGGICTDVTKRLHPDTRLMAESLASSMGLMTTGLDFITTDIEKSCTESGAFIEINATPGLASLIAAGADPIDIGCQVLGKTLGRVPVNMVVVTPNKLQEAMVWLQARHWPRGTGFACSEYASLGGVPLRIGDARPWSMVDALLRHRTLDSLWILCDETALQRWGLPVDRLEKAWLFDINLPEEWLDVIAKNADKVVSRGSWTISLNNDLFG